MHIRTHTRARVRAKTAHCGARPALLLNISSEQECLQSKSCTRTPERAVDGEKRCKDKRPESAQRKNDRGDGEWCSGKRSDFFLASHSRSKSCTRTPERAVDGEKRCKDKRPESAQRKNDRGDGEWCSGKRSDFFLASHSRSKSCTRTPERAVDGEEWCKDKRSERARTGAYSLYVTGRASSVEPYLRRYASSKVF